MENRITDRLLQKMDCPYGKGPVIVVQDTEEGLVAQCMWAEEALRKHSWSNSKRERELRYMGCPRPTRKKMFKKQECLFNDGKLRIRYI